MNQRQERQNYMEQLNKEALKKMCQDPFVGYGYRELCRKLNLKILSSGSTSQQAQLKQLSCICEFEFNPQTHKYYFKEVYDHPEPYDSLRANQLMLNQNWSREESNRKGVYGIFSELDNTVYIGSTQSSLYKKYQGHLDRNLIGMYPTALSKLLTEPHTIELLYENTDCMDSEELRKLQQKYIEQLEEYYNVINNQNISVYRKHDKWQELFEEYKQRYNYTDKQAEKMLLRFLKYD